MHEMAIIRMKLEISDLVILDNLGMNITDEVRG